jgi:hypothetical protein
MFLFEEANSCLSRVIAAMNACKPKRFVDQARLIYKRSELKDAAKQCGDDIDFALGIFQVRQHMSVLTFLHHCTCLQGQASNWSVQDTL